MRQISVDVLADQLDSMQRDVNAVGHCFVGHKYLIQHRDLMLDLANLTHAVRRGHISNDELLECLKLSRIDVDGLGQNFSKHLPPEYWYVRRQKDSMMAQIVFGIPEILENILSHCYIVDLLSMYETCTGVRGIIEASSKLQTQMCLRPAPATTPEYFPFHGFVLPGFSCGLDRYGPGPGSRKIKARIEISTMADRIYFPYIGRRLQQIFICQPPIRQLLVQEDCPFEWGTGFDPDDRLQLISATGLTIGDLSAMAELLILQHNGCELDFGDVLSRAPRPATFEVLFEKCQSKEEWDAAAHLTAHMEARLYQDMEDEFPDAHSELSENVESHNDGADDERGEHEHLGEENGDTGEYERNEDEQATAERQLADAVYEGYGDDVAMQ